MPNFQEYSDQELIVLIRQQNHEAFTEVYNRYWRKMLMIAGNHCTDTNSAQDVVHEVFLSLWENRTKLDIQNIPAYLVTAVKFQIFKYYQKENRRAELARQNYLFSDLSLDEEALDARFLSEYIQGIVEKMPEKYQQVFHYSRNVGLKNVEIAEKINTTEKGVEGILTRALRTIRVKLKDYGVAIFILTLLK